MKISTLLLLLTLLANTTLALPETYEADDLDPSRTAQTAADLLLAIPGFTEVLNTRGGSQLATSGLNSASILLLINNQPLMGDSQNPLLQARRISAARVSKITVIRDDTPTTEWSGGAAATINLILENRQNEIYVSAAAEQEHNITISRVSSGNPLAIGISKHRQQDLRSGDSDNRNIDLSWQKRLSPRMAVSTNLLSLNENLGSDARPIAAGYRTDPLMAGTQAFDQVTRNNRANARLDYDIDTRKLQISLNAETLSSNQQADDHDHLYDLDRFGIGMRLEDMSGEHRWTLGTGYWFHHHTESANISASEELSLQARENRYQLYLQDDWQLTTNTRLQTALRMESYTIDQSRAPNGGRTRVASATWWMPTLNVIYQINAHSNVGFYNSQTVRMAPLQARFPYSLTVDEHTWTGNDALQDEIVNRHALQYRYRFTTGVSAEEEGLIVRLEQRATNNTLITEEINDQNDAVIKQTNDSSTQMIRGIEARFRQNLNDAHNWTLAAAAGIWKHTGTHHPPNQSGPTMQSSITAEYWPLADLILGAQMHYSRQTPTDAVTSEGPETVHYPVWHLNEIYAGKILAPQWRLGLRGGWRAGGLISSGTDASRLDSSWLWTISLDGRFR